VLAGVVSALVLGFALRDSADHPPADTVTLLVEGRIGVLVPATWAAQRVTSGPGSARLQVVSPTDTDVALHITQATDGGDLLATASALRLALGEQPDGVFVDFNALDHRVGKDAVTYREVRAEREIDWVVFVDDTVRIAIGCQSAPGREHLVRAACDEAIGSAHALF
jgi:type VII secretion-associated protein (TIGR03931 family)